MRQRIKIWHPELSNISEKATIGDDVVIHSQVWIGDDVAIGDRVKIQALCFIPNGITIEDDCFIGHGVIFANDKYPPSHGKDWSETKVERGASIGANCTILPGITIGRGAMIGAGAIISKDVPKREVWICNSAKRLKSNCSRGFDECVECGGC